MTSEWTGLDWMGNGAVQSYAVAVGGAFDPVRSELVVFGGNWLADRDDATWLRNAAGVWNAVGNGTPEWLDAVT